MRIALAFAVLALVCAHASAHSRSATRRALARAGAGVGMMARHELQYEIDYDSGGCPPLTVWENFPKDGSEWWNWEKRLPELAATVNKLSGGAKARAIFDAMAVNKRYFMYIDGRSQHKGENAFKAHYMEDMKEAHNIFGDLIAKGLSKDNLGLTFYNKIHNVCFKQDAKDLKKTNGFRGPNSWVYLPMPDRPLGVYHNVHKNGKLYFDPNLRKCVKNSEYKITGWKYNRRFQYRWTYNNMEYSAEEEIITGLFNKFWEMVNAIPDSKAEGEKRNLKLNSIVWLYHSLENFHVFIDGNGRTNLLLLQGLLSWAGLHPISYYNSMESALTSVDQEREVVLEAYFKWETAYQTGRSAWTIEEINRKRHECDVATRNLLEPRKAGEKRPWQPDTQGGCLCVKPETCDTNPKWDGDGWCYTDANCFWKWDYCAQGRSRQASVPQSEWNPPQGPAVQNVKGASG